MKIKIVDYNNHSANFVLPEIYEEELLAQQNSLTVADLCKKYMSDHQRNRVAVELGDLKRWILMQ